MRKKTLTIGIPAYNEEKNIAYLIRSILRQKQNNYKLEKIIVICDGSTDNTCQIVSNLSKKFKIISLIDEPDRLGKATALNRIYEASQSDFLLQLDADVVLDRDKEINLLMEEILKNKQTSLVGGKFIPVKQNTVMGKFSYVSFLCIEDSFLRLNKGNNIFALVGGCSLVKKKLYKSFTYPKKVISDQNYLFVKATKNNSNAFKLAKNTQIYIRTVSTFADWRLLGARSVKEDKASVAYFFGKDILKNYSMPKNIYFMSIFKFFLKDPINTIGAMIMNLFIRLFPYKKAIVAEGMWELATSSKQGIVLKTQKILMKG